MDKKSKSHTQSETEDSQDALLGNDVADMFSRGLWSRPGFLVRRLHQIHYAIFFDECKDENITPVQYGILTVLAINPWMDQTEIGHEVGLDRTTSADVIRRLEEKGWLERRINPLDRRSRQARVTEEGLLVMEQLKSRMVRSQQRLLQPLHPAERQMFMKLLTELVSANNEHGRAVLKKL